MEILLVYLSLVNALTCLLMHTDKEKARRKKWRIPEKTLLLLCAVGGSLGGLFGMYLFRHKTNHRAFAIGIPTMLVLHITLLAIVLTQFSL